MEDDVMEELRDFNQRSLERRVQKVAEAWNAGYRNVSQLARTMGVSRDAVYTDLEKAGIDVKADRTHPRPFIQRNSFFLGDLAGYTIVHSGLANPALTLLHSCGWSKDIDGEDVPVGNIVIMLMALDRKHKCVHEKG
jgi:hypothetical protein